MCSSEHGTEIEDEASAMTTASGRDGSDSESNGIALLLPIIILIVAFASLVYVLARMPRRNNGRNEYSATDDEAAASPTEAMSPTERKRYIVAKLETKVRCCKFNLPYSLDP